MPRYQFRYDFSDLDVVYDASRLILSQLSNNFVGTEVDKHRLETFLLTFIPVFFDLNRESFAERMKDINEQSRQTNDSDNEVPSLTASPPGEPLLDTAEHQWISMPPTHDIKTSFKREDFHLYATSNIYCFFRMFQLFYERLRSVKCLEHRVKNDITRSRMAKPAIDLGLVDKLPSEFFSDVGDEANYYKQIVNMCEETVRSELEVSVLEETLRRFYMPDGWHLYSLEKMLSALLRFALQILVSDNKDKSLDIVNLFYKDRQEDETTHEKELTYRRQVERLGREDIFRIRYVSLFLMKGPADIRTVPRAQHMCRFSKRTIRLTRRTNWSQQRNGLTTYPPLVCLTAPKALPLLAYLIYAATCPVSWARAETRTETATHTTITI